MGQMGPMWGCGCLLGRIGHVGISPTWVGQGESLPCSHYIKGGPLPFLPSNSLSFLSSFNVVPFGAALGVEKSTINTPPCCYSSVHLSTSATSDLGRRPGVVVYTVCV